MKPESHHPIKLQGTNLPTPDPRAFPSYTLSITSLESPEPPKSIGQMVSAILLEVGLAPAAWGAP